MLRSMMQVYVKGSAEAVHTYQRAFEAEILGLYPDGNGGYMHSELNAHGQILAVSESTDGLVVGNTMQFCFHFGEGGEKYVKRHMKFCGKRQLSAFRWVHVIIVLACSL